MAVSDFVGSEWTVGFDVTVRNMKKDKILFSQGQYVYVDKLSPRYTVIISTGDMRQELSLKEFNRLVGSFQQ